VLTLFGKRRKPTSKLKSLNEFGRRNDEMETSVYTCEVRKGDWKRNQLKLVKVA